jgi:hypothetical protein
MVPLPGCQVHSQKNPGNLICSRVHSVVLGRENNKTSRKGRRQWMLLPYVTVAPPKNGGTYVIKMPTLGFRLPCSKYLGCRKDREELSAGPNFLSIKVSISPMIIFSKYIILFAAGLLALLQSTLARP